MAVDHVREGEQKVEELLEGAVMESAPVEEIPNGIISHCTRTREEREDIHSHLEGDDARRPLSEERSLHPRSALVSHRFPLHLLLADV